MELTTDILQKNGPHTAATRLAKSVEKLTAILASRKVDSQAIRDFVEGTGAVNRRVIAQELYEASFASGKEVIYLSIMSKNTLGSMPDRIRRAAAARTTLNVLTWNPGVGLETMDAFGNHLGEQETTEDQVRGAYATWQQLSKQHPGTIKKAGAYLSSPTMQGLVVLDDWALVEMIPYRTPPSVRLSVFLSAALDTELFTIFQSSFKNLLADSSPV